MVVDTSSPSRTTTRPSEAAASSPPSFLQATSSLFYRNSNAFLFPTTQQHNKQPSPPPPPRSFMQTPPKQESSTNPASVLFGSPGLWPSQSSLLSVGGGSQQGTTASSSVGPSFQRTTQPSSPQHQPSTATSLSPNEEAKELSEVVLKLQDLIIQASQNPQMMMSAGGKDMLVAKMGNIMKETPAAQRLDITSQGRFMTSPAQQITTEPPTANNENEEEEPSLEFQPNEGVLEEEEEEEENETLPPPTVISPYLFPPPHFMKPTTAVPAVGLPAPVTSPNATSPTFSGAVPSFFPAGWPSVVTTTTTATSPELKKYNPMMQHPHPPTTVPPTTVRSLTPPVSPPAASSVPMSLKTNTMTKRPIGSKDIMTAADLEDREKGGATVEEMRGQLMSLTRYQAGCRFLQRQLDATAGDQVRGMQIVGYVLEEIGNNLQSVVTDVCGQYLIPKVVEHASTEQKTFIVRHLCPYVFRIAVDPCGSHGLQRILPFINDQQAEELGKCMQPHIVAMSKDSKGNYLIQAFVKCFGPGARIQFIIDSAVANLITLSNHKVGCTVVTRCIEYSDPHQMNQFLDTIHKNISKLVDDQYGNYVLQHVLINCDRSYSSRIITSLFGRIGLLCQQKFGSNVVEKCLEAAEPSAFERMMTEMTKHDVLARLIVDPYGNFVVQKLLDLATPDQHARLVSLIVPLLGQVKGSPYSVHIQKKLLHV